MGRHLEKYLPTNGICRICSGKLLSIEVNEYHHLRTDNWGVAFNYLAGYYCEDCGLQYKKLPKKEIGS